MGTVTEAANAVKLGSADGAIIWDATARQYPTLKVVRLPHLERVTANVTVAVCKNAQSRTEARWFAEYLAGEGQKHFRAAGMLRRAGTDQAQSPRRQAGRGRGNRSLRRRHVAARHRGDDQASSKNASTSP